MKILNGLVIALMLVSFHGMASELSSRAVFYLERARDKSVPLDDRCAAYDSVLSLDPHKDDLEILLEKAGLLGRENRSEESKALYDYILSTISPAAADTYCRVMFGRGNMMLYAYDTQAAANDFGKVLSVDKPDSLRYWDAKSYLRLADVSSLLGNLSDSEAFYNQSAKTYNDLLKRGLVPEHEKLAFKLHAHQAKGFLHIERNEYEQAFKEMKKAADCNPDHHQEMGLLLNMGLVFHRKGDLDIAADHYRDVIAREVPGATSRAQAIINMLSLLLAQHDTDSAFSLINRYSDEIMMRNDDGCKVCWWLNVAEAESNAGHYDKAVKAWERAYSLNDSIRSMRGSNVISNLMRNHNGADGFEASGLKNENEELRNWLYAAISGLIISIVISLVLFGALRRRSVLPKNGLESGGFVSGSALEKCDEQGKELEKYKRRVMVMSMYMTRVGKTFETILHDVDGLVAGNADNAGAIKRAVRELSDEQHLWEVFRSYFEEVNQDFFNRLYKVNPAISNSEARMCAYMLMKLTTKEIATLTNRSVRTVETTKYNLRKKLRINGSSEEWMHRLSVASLAEVEEMSALAQGREEGCDL